MAVASSGCAPSFSPLYRDYDIGPVETGQVRAERAQADPSTASLSRAGDEVYDRIRTALAEAGWTEAEAAAPNVISTESRTYRDWGLYRVLVSLDVVPIGGQHVRVLFHPVRRYFTGGRSKIPYLDGGMRRDLLPALNEAFKAQGLRPIGTPRERDEEQVEGT